MEMLPLQAGDVPDTEADVSELIAAVDYRPKVSGKWAWRSSSSGTYCTAPSKFK